MNAEETKKRGMEYCNKHYSDCDNCPLHNNDLCIQGVGDLFIDLEDVDFIEFVKRFNFMIKEIYKYE